MKVSISLQTTDVKLTGLQLKGELQLPFLKIGETWAHFHCMDSRPLSSDFLKRINSGIFLSHLPARVAFWDEADLALVIFRLLAS